MKFFSKKIKSKTEEKKNYIIALSVITTSLDSSNPDIIFNERDESDILLATAKIAQE